MPDHMEENTLKREFTFYSDDGGFRATHEDNSPGDEIFFLSIIDCLTHYGTIKKLEHLWSMFPVILPLLVINGDANEEQRV